MGHFNGPGNMRHGMMTHGMMGYSWIWIIGVILLTTLVIIGIVLIVKQSQHSVQTKPNEAINHRPLEILKERFAKGEISEEEYREKKKILEE